MGIQLPWQIARLEPAKPIHDAPRNVLESQNQIIYSPTKAPMCRKWVGHRHSAFQSPQNEYPMKVIITGGGGFLGQRLAAALIARGGLSPESSAPASLTELVLLDQVFPANRFQDDRVRYLEGDISEPKFVAQATASGADAVFHLAAVVSAQAESDIDLGMRVNIDGVRAVLEACRSPATAPRFVFTSSVAAFGGDLPQVVTDTSPVTPQSSYGTHKVIGELLVADYSRKGYIDGRSLRRFNLSLQPCRSRSL